MSRNADKSLDTFYGIHMPVESDETDSKDQKEIIVFNDKSEALTWMKSYKKARFKAFTNYEQAVNFSINGLEYLNDTDNNITPDVPLIGEKPNQFRGPSSQNLVKLRKNIESGNLEIVHDTIWENPRYLIGIGDTPSILQEGSRYNGLHVAAKCKNASMCTLLLNTVSDIAFIKKIYPDDGTPEDRAKVLLDLYLNTPDKGFNETPLHFASKFGAADCVEVLVSFAECDKYPKNKYGKTPIDIICERYSGADKPKVENCIYNLLKETYYVPVIRSEDNCASPTVGEPFSPACPLVLSKDPLSPRMEIHAYAGPMDKEGAENFRKVWKTPPRNTNSSNSINSLRFRDHEKGLERLGNTLAHKMNVGWKEYWPFLDCFVDLASEEGLKLFEEYLAAKTIASFNHSKGYEYSPIEKPLRLEKARELSPMTDLCNALQACHLHDTNSINSPQNALFYIDKSLNVFAKRISTSIKSLLLMDCKNCHVLEGQMKRLQHLMGSYMSDQRFQTVDLQMVHARLAYLTKEMLLKDVQDVEILQKMLNIWLENCNDVFSSDEDAAHANFELLIRSQRKGHCLCLLGNIQQLLSSNEQQPDVKDEAQCELLWKSLRGCRCQWQPNKLSGRRGKNKLFPCNNSNNFETKQFSTNNLFNVMGVAHLDPQYSSDEEEEQYFTPPSSPSQIDSFEVVFSDDDDDREVFYESRLPDFEVFIEGDFPSKIDYAAYNALKYSTNVKLSPEEYPNVYRWQHTVGLYSEQERNSWCNSKIIHQKFSSGNRKDDSILTSTPSRKDMDSNFSPVTSPLYYSSKLTWMRIAGANSPHRSSSSNNSNHNLQKNRLSFSNIS